jgi:hypothetical protein
VDVAYSGRPLGRKTWIVAPLRVVRVSTRSSVLRGGGFAGGEEALEDGAEFVDRAQVDLR